MDPRRPLEIIATAFGLTTEEIRPEQAFNLLANTRRRLVIETLIETTGPISLEELVDTVVRKEYGQPVPAVDPEIRESVYASLHQTHLPRLAEQQVIRYNRDHRTVELTTRGQQFEPLLKPTATGDQSTYWPFLYLSLAVVLTLAVVLALLEIIPVEPLSVAAVGVVMVFVLAAMHTVTTTDS